MTTNAEWQQRGNKVFIGNYARYPVAMVKGEGCRLVDADGREYLDFLSGIAVCALGHCHPAVTEAICRQAAELVHVSNLYYTGPRPSWPSCWSPTPLPTRCSWPTAAPRRTRRPSSWRE